MTATVLFGAVLSELEERAFIRHGCRPGAVERVCRAPLPSPELDEHRKQREPAWFETKARDGGVVILG